MNILLIGNGHSTETIAQRLAQDPRVTQIFLATPAKNVVDIPSVRAVDIREDSVNELHSFALDNEIELTIPTTLAPLVHNIAEHFRNSNLPIVGPSAAATRLETSRTFARNLLQEHGIPTPEGQVYDNYRDAIHHVMMAQELPILKVDKKQASGGGVYIPDCFNDAEVALHEIFVQKKYGEEGAAAIIEERVEGEHLSAFVFTDGPRFQMHVVSGTGDRVAPEQDHELSAAIRSRVVEPLLYALESAGTPYTGFLRIDLIVAEGGPYPLSFGCHFDSEEACSLLKQYEGNLPDLFLACATPRPATVVGAPELPVVSSR